MNTTLLIIVLLLGVVLLALEIVALPGGIAGAFGVGLIAFGVWQTYALFGSKTGTIVLLCAIALCVLMLIWFMKTKTWKRFSLNEESDSKVNQLEPAVKVGTKGVTISRLAPTGKALIDGQTMEVHAVNKFIDPDRPIEVVAIEGYRIDVVETSDTRFENNNNQ
ncbi:MAG: NfeD family protein [Bacteroidales bacterium]|nr:NfeD family protein [Bacteroidales bacterium]